ncbi:hypothetical protein GF412_02220 [Candidatus Micrarchaeota archaeon]|nr:hypothetical protein [Candidatus Micrarchaeota archaeon]MBD3417777.1 hypothetical protein [Candidatus Micrarchaeota archaeon]
MARRSASKKKKGKMEDKRLGDLNKVISGIEKLVDLRMDERRLLKRVGTFEKNDRELTKEEMARLPEAAEWTTGLRETLEGGNLKKLEKVG